MTGSETELLRRYDRAITAHAKQDIAYESYEDNINHVPVNSAFHPDNLLPALLITAARVYDVQLLILKNMNPVEADKLVDLHASGEFLSPPPSFASDS